MHSQSRLPEDLDSDHFRKENDVGALKWNHCDHLASRVAHFSSACACSFKCAWDVQQSRRGFCTTDMSPECEQKIIDLLELLDSRVARYVPLGFALPKPRAPWCRRMQLGNVSVLGYILGWNSLFLRRVSKGARDSEACSFHQGSVWPLLLNTSILQCPKTSWVAHKCACKHRGIRGRVRGRFHGSGWKH